MQTRASSKKKGREPSAPPGPSVADGPDVSGAASSAAAESRASELSRQVDPAESKSAGAPGVLVLRGPEGSGTSGGAPVNQVDSEMKSNASGEDMSSGSVDSRSGAGFSTRASATGSDQYAKNFGRIFSNVCP